MNLLVDIGNSRVKWVLADDRGLGDSASAARDARWLQALPFDRCRAVWVANVAAQTVANAVDERAAEWGLVCHRPVAEPCFDALQNGYATPDQLGVDRWMACIAAVARSSASTLIVDAGTALTLDWIDADRCHRGGLITPGIATMRQRLTGATQLELPDETASSTVIGTSPSEAIERGTRQSAISLVNDMAARFPTTECLLTGGEADLLAGQLAGDWQRVPDLVLEGLAEYAAAADHGLPSTVPCRQNRA